MVARDVEDIRIVRGKDDREGPLEAVLHRLRAVADRVFGPDGDIDLLARAMIVAGHALSLIHI